MEQGKERRGFLRENLPDSEILLENSKGDFKLLEVSMGGMSLTSNFPQETGSKLLLKFHHFSEVPLQVCSCREMVNSETDVGSPLFRVGCRYVKQDLGEQYYGCAMDLFLDTIEAIEG